MGDTVTTIIITPLPIFTPTSIIAHITVTTARTIIPTGTINLTVTGTDTRGGFLYEKTLDRVTVGGHHGAVSRLYSL
jgi:hypothetical protein